MKSAFRNLLQNPVFEYWDHSLLRSTSGYTANRWDMTRSGGTPPTLTIGKGAADASISTPLWYRGKPCLELVITDLGSSDANIRVRQTVENGQRYTTEHLALSLICFGPSGGTFQVGVNSVYKTVTTKGQRYTDDFGYVNIPTEVRLSLPLNSVASTISCDIFNRPTMIGTYQFVIAQLETLRENFMVSPWEFRTPEVERAMLNRYAWPVNAGNSGQATTTDLCMGLRFPVEMRTTPTYASKLTAIGALSIVDQITGTPAVSTVATTHTADNITAMGARLALTGGWAGLTANRNYMLGTDAIGVFSAEY